MRSEFITAVKKHQPEFDLELPEQSIEQLADYYEIIQENNPLLHLVGPCSPEEFAVRHILESLTLIKFLPRNTRIADVGAGAGLPSIPCLIIRDDLNAVLIESKEKKARFLVTAVEKLGIADRVQIINRQFEEVEGGQFEFVTCRALDKFTVRLPGLKKWAGSRTLLFFGGNSLRVALQNENLIFDEKLLPMSEQRFLFVVKR